MTHERPCDLCRVQTLAVLLERVSVFPYAYVCEPCAGRLARDDDYDDEPAGPSCECGGTGCRRCLDVRGWL